MFWNDSHWPCVWSAGVVSAGRLSHTGTMRRTAVSSVRRTTGPNLGSCVMAVQSPSPPDSSWWVQAVRNRISAVCPHHTTPQPLQLHTQLHTHANHERAAIYNSQIVLMKGKFVWPFVLMHSLLAVLFSVSTRARVVYWTTMIIWMIYDPLNSFIVPGSSYIYSFAHGIGIAYLWPVHVIIWVVYTENHFDPQKTKAALPILHLLCTMYSYRIDVKLGLHNSSK